MMNEPTNVQILRDSAGQPTHAVLPYAEYQAILGKKLERPTIPHAVMKLVLEDDVTPARAWREHLSLTQADVAARLGITQSAYAQQESAEKPRKATLKKIAEALGVDVRMLDI